MSETRALTISEAEAWALDDLIRHTWEEDGRKIGRDLLVKVFAIPTEFEDRRAKPYPPDELLIAITEDEAWAIEYHIRRAFVDSRGNRIGHSLLLKTFRILLSLRNQAELQSLGINLSDAQPGPNDAGLGQSYRQRESGDNERDF